MDQEKKTEKKPKVNIKKWTIRSIYWGLAVMSIAPVSVLVSELYQHKQPNKTINPEIEIITEYQMARNSKIPVELAKLQAEEMVEVSNLYKFPVELIVGMVEKESLFNPFSVSSVGATGLMQIYQDDSVKIDDSSRYNIQYSLQIGCTILKNKLKIEKGNLSKALEDYSGIAKNYPEGVYECIGRFMMFHNKNATKEIQIVEN